MKTINIKDLEIKTIQKPDKNNYFSWHSWRTKAVEESIKQLSKRLFCLGYKVVFANNYLFAEKEKHHVKISYIELEHRFVIGNILECIDLDYDDNMIITNSDDELLSYIDDKKEYGEYINSLIGDFYFEIIK